MVRRNDPTIDEEALRQAIGRQSSHGSVLRTPEDPTTDDEPAPPPEAAASEACEPRRRRLRMPDYEQTFLCDHDVRHRSNLYASEEIKRKLLRCRAAARTGQPLADGLRGQHPAPSPRILPRGDQPSAQTTKFSKHSLKPSTYVSYGLSNLCVPATCRRTRGDPVADEILVTLSRTSPLCNAHTSATTTDARQRRTPRLLATLSKPLCKVLSPCATSVIAPCSLHRHERTRHTVARGTRVRCAKHHAEQLRRCYRARTSGTLPYTDRGPSRS